MTSRRNPQGLVFHPTTGALYSTEHGPNDNDEVNVILAGRNYADLIPRWKGSLLVTSLKGAALYRLTLSADGRRVTGKETLYAGQFGRLRDALVAPDGSVYLATSNRDGRGSPASDDDRILRIRPGP